MKTCLRNIILRPIENSTSTQFSDEYKKAFHISKLITRYITFDYINYQYYNPLSK